MPKKPTYEELEQRVRELEEKSLEHTQVEEALKSERDKLMALLDGLSRTSIGVDIVSNDYEVLQQNQTLIDRFGDIVGKKCYKEYMALDEPCSFCPMVKALENKRLERAEVRGADGRDYEILAAPLTNPDGTIDKAIEVVQDISERKRTEEALRESENKYRRLAENSPDMIYRMSLPDGKYEYVSPASTTILGYPPEEWYENPLLIREIIHSDWHLYFKDQWDRLLKGDVPPMYEYQIVHKNGGVRWINQRNVLVKGEDGRPVAIEGILTNITERKQAEEALLDEKEFTETALNTQLDTFFLFEPANRKAIRWNRAFNDITGYSDEEIVEMVAPDSYYSPEDLKRASIFTQEVLETGTGTIELELICKDGRKVPSEYKVSVIKDDEGKPKYFISIGRDITDRKQAEEEREKTIDELQRALKEIKTLRGILPLCSFCKKIRDDKGYWEQVDVYIHKYSQADISHSICPECAKEHYPDLELFDD